MGFAEALSFCVNELEGGYILTSALEDPSIQNYAGIRRDVYEAEGFHSWPPSREQVANFYRKCYWDRCRCGELPEPSDAVLFQCAVNVGQDHTIKILQRAVGANPDGDFGPKTLAAVMATRRDDLADLILAYQNAHYRQLDGRWLKGWLNRTEKVHRAIDEGRI